jgi:hypothetical protein
VHFNPQVNPFMRSEDESVSWVGASACFTQRASRTEPYLELGHYTRQMDMSPPLNYLIFVVHTHRRVGVRSAYGPAVACGGPDP